MLTIAGRSTFWPREALERLGRDAHTLAAGEAALTTRPGDGRDLEIGRLKAQVGDLIMTTELRNYNQTWIVVRHGDLPMPA